jgi:hypothetical protein
MTIRYQCTECDSVLKIRDDKAGQAGRCPQCKTAFVIPEPEAEPEPDAAVDSDTQAQSDQGTGDAEDDAMAFLMESGDVPAATPLASTALDDGDGDGDEMTPAIPPPPPSPEERQLHRPPERPKVDTDDTSIAASDLLTRSESARAAAADEPPPERGPRIDVEQIKHIAKRQLLPLAGGIVVVAGICYLLFNMVASDSKLPPLASVTGTITLDGKPLEQATVNFQPITDERDAEQRRLGGSVGRSDTDGIYTLTYPGGHDGAVLGMHIVRVNKTDKQGLEVLGKKYHLQSRMQHEVKEGSNRIDLLLKSEATPAAVDPLGDSIMP